MDDLSEALKSATDGSPKALDLSALHRRARTRLRRRRIAAGAAALSMMAMAGIGVAAATRESGSSTRFITAAADGAAAPTSAGTADPCTATTTSTTTTPVASTTTDGGPAASPEPATVAPGALTEEQLQAGINDEQEVPPATTTPSTDESTTSTTTDPVRTTTTTTVCTSETIPTTVPDIGPEVSSPTTDTGSTNPSTSTVSAPPTPTTTTEAAELLQLGGSFVGESPIVEPDPQGCPQLRHRFDAEVILDGEPGWGLRESYCGVNDGETWQGSGTFEVTGPAGDSFAGTFSSRVDLPTTGEPYRMTVTDGTGRFDGLVGTCDVDNHLESTTQGRQRQYGTLTCQLKVTP